MQDVQESEVLLRPAPKFSERQLFLLILAFSLLLVSVLLISIKVLGNRGEPMQVVQEAEVLTPEEAAERYGYKIHYKQTGDAVGRTVITRDRGVFDLWGTTSSLEEGTITHIWGQVGSIEEIAGSGDLIVRIINPVENEELGRVRIDRTMPNLPQGENLEIFTTPVFLDVLGGPFAPERIGYAGQWSGEDFRRVLREGDFLGAGIALTWEDPVAKTGKLVPSRDELGNLLLTGITIRRIGGDL